MVASVLYFLPCKTLYQHPVHAKWPLHIQFYPPSCFPFQCINYVNTKHSAEITSYREISVELDLLWT